MQICEVLDALTNVIRTLADFLADTAISDFLALKAPEDIQALAREKIFLRMHSEARGIHGRSSAQWIKRHPQTRVPCNAAVGNDFLNSMSVDLAGTPAEKAKMLKARDLQTFFKHACANPNSLNVDWTDRNP